MALTAVSVSNILLFSPKYFKLFKHAAESGLPVVTGAHMTDRQMAMRNAAFQWDGCIIINR